MGEKLSDDAMLLNLDMFSYSSCGNILSLERLSPVKCVARVNNYYEIFIGLTALETINRLYELVQIYWK